MRYVPAIAASPRWSKQRFAVAALGVAAVVALLVVAIVWSHSSDARRPSADVASSSLSEAPAPAPTATAAPVPPGSAEPVVVHLASMHQTIDGFGVSEKVFNDAHLTGTAGADVPPDSRNQILSALYRDLGLTRMRPLLGQGVEPVNDNSDPNVLDASKFDFAGPLTDGHIEIVKEAQAFGLTTFFAAPVLLESWMSPDDSDEYVEWALTELEHWRDQGLDPLLYSPLNEPAARGKRSAQWMHDVVLKLGTRARAAGLQTRFVLPDDLNAGTAYARAKAVLDDPACRPFVAALAYHLYNDDQDSDRQRMADLARQYNLPVWMTEYTRTSYDKWPGALEWAKTIHQLLAADNVSAVDALWGWFGSQDQANTLISLQFDGTQFQGFTLRPPYYVMGQFSRFVRPGMVRVDVDAPASLQVSAYTSATQVVVVAINGDASAHSVAVALDGGALTSGVSATRTSGTEQWVTLPSIPGNAAGFTADLPPGSITTFVANR